MTITLTESDALKLTLPGDLPGLLDGWCGPVEVVEQGHDREPGDEWVLATRSGRDWFAITNGPHEAELGNRGSISDVRLPLARWECRARVAHWLAEGERTEGAIPCNCGRHTRFVGGTDADPEPECDACGGRPVYGGWRRRPVDAAQWLDWPGGIEPWIAAFLLWVGARRAVARVELPLGILGCIDPGTDDGPVRRMGRPARRHILGDRPKCTAFGLYFGTDAEHLLAGYALMGSSGITVAVP